jgi:epidermal growth factor receptor substrate 15
MQMFDDFEHAEGDIASITQRVHQQDLHEWEQALSRAVKQHEFNLNCELLKRLDPTTSSQGTQPTDKTDKDTHALKFSGVSVKQSKKGETLQMDVLVQSQAELAQQQKLNKVNQAQIKTLLTSSPNPIYTLDKDGKLVDCNHAFERLFKVKSTKIKQQYIEDLSLFPEDICRIHTSGSTGLISASLSRDKEFDAELTDGKVRHLKLRLQTLTDVENKPTGMMGIVQDLTDLKQTKLALEQTRKHFTTILDLAPVAVATIDAEDKIITANIAMTDRLGVSERDLKKDSFYQLFNDPSNAGKAAKQIQQQGRLRQFTAQLKGKHGELHPSELHVDLLDKDKQHYLCWISDRTGEQFHQDKFESLLQHSSMPMAIFSDEGFTKLNPAACQFFKIEDEQDLWGATPYSAKLNTDDIAVNELERQITKVKLDGQAKFFRWEHKVNNELLPCQATYVPMYKGQEFDSILCIWMDFTELEQADQARLAALNLHKEAEKEVAEKQHQLASSQAQLATKAQDLAATETKLQQTQHNLTEKQQAYSSLQQQHESVTHNLQALQQDYKQSRKMLDDAQSANAELSTNQRSRKSN